MVNRKNLDKKFALISVYNKDKLEYLCKNLKKNNFNFISTKSTSTKIKSLGFKCLNVSQITGFDEIMGGRVKTLNTKIFGSILFNRNDEKQVRELNKLKIPKIDIVVVNLYPFYENLELKQEDKIIEMIDIGGPSLLRAASKNYEHVTTITNIDDYINLINNLKKNNGVTDINFRKNMAARVFKLTSQYDKFIYNWFEKNNNKKTLKYGENPDQKAYIEKFNNKSVFDYQINGKLISYNNIIDIDSGYNCLLEFSEPTCVIIKHTNACGVASDKSTQKAFLKALECDRKSAFGGVVLLNRIVDKKLAEKMSLSFFEVIVAKGFHNDALKILEKKKRLILLKIKKHTSKNFMMRSTIFGNLFQNINREKINRKFLRLVSNKKPSKRIIDDLIFSLKVTKHLKSNSIVLSYNKQTVGIGSGQTSRIDALKIAINKKKSSFRQKNFVCASDGFFPFNDGVKLLNKIGCKALVQPRGSINDKNVVAYSLKNSLTLFFSKNRLFKH